uniref:Astacin domain-containing protein n=1 Tax=Parastrongyloides trichosuri TaxID=131310 RepID=A0A0N4ZWR5_PARTI
MINNLSWAIIFILSISSQQFLFLNIPNKTNSQKVVDYASSMYGMGFVPIRNAFINNPKRIQFKPNDYYYRSTKAVFSPSMSSFCILYPDSCNYAEV